MRHRQWERRRAVSSSVARLPPPSLPLSLARRTVKVPLRRKSHSRSLTRPSQRWIDTASKNEKTRRCSSKSPRQVLRWMLSVVYDIRFLQTKGSRWEACAPSPRGTGRHAGCDAVRTHWRRSSMFLPGSASEMQRANMPLKCDSDVWYIESTCVISPTTKKRTEPRRAAGR